MPDLNFRKRLPDATRLFWLLFLYIVAALVWWYISLERQNREIAQTSMALVQRDAIPWTWMREEQARISELKKRRSVKYAGEGAIFLVVTLVGAFFVYRAVRKQLALGQQQQDFIMAVTHELKTPLAVGKLNIETLLKRKLPEEQQQKLLQNTLYEMHRLNDLTTNILIVSRLDAGSYQRNNEAIHLSTLAQQVAADFEKQFPAIPLVTHIESDVFTSGDTLLIKLVISNLLGNAAKYSGSGKPVTLTLANKNKPVLQVADNGPGIPGSEKEQVFRKFYRIENESTRKTQGTGLGLYLCKKILLSHKAGITVADNQPSGCIFTVTFKANG